MILGDRIAIGALGSAVVALALGAWLVLAPPTGDAGSHAVVDPLAALPSRSAAPHVGGTLVIDVEGGVKRPGIVQLPTGSRVADSSSSFYEEGFCAAENWRQPVRAARPAAERRYRPGVGVDSLTPRHGVPTVIRKLP